MRCQEGRHHTPGALRNRCTRMAQPSAAPTVQAPPPVTACPLPAHSTAGCCPWDPRRSGRQSRGSPPGTCGAKTWSQSGGPPTNQPASNQEWRLLAAWGFMQGCCPSCHTMPRTSQSKPSGAPTTPSRPASAPHVAAAVRAVAVKAQHGAGGGHDVGGAGGADGLGQHRVDEACTGAMRKVHICA